MGYFLAFTKIDKFDPKCNPNYKTEQAAIDAFNKHVKDYGLKVLEAWHKIDGVNVCKIGIVANPGSIVSHQFDLWVLPVGEV